MDDLIHAQVQASQQRHVLPAYRHYPTLTPDVFATPEPDCVFVGYDAEGLAIYRFTERFW